MDTSVKSEEQVGGLSVRKVTVVLADPNTPIEPVTGELLSSPIEVLRTRRQSVS